MLMFLNAASIYSEEVRKVIYDIVSPILMIVMVLLSVALLVFILRQNGDPENLGAITGNSETFYGKNKEQSKEYVYKKITVWLGIALVAVSVIYFILRIL